MFHSCKRFVFNSGMPTPLDRLTVTDDFSGRRTGWANWWLFGGDKADLQWRSRGRLELTIETAWVSKSRVLGLLITQQCYAAQWLNCTCRHLPGSAAAVDYGLLEKCASSITLQTAAKKHRHTSAQTHRQSFNTPSLKQVLLPNHLLPLQCPGNKYLMSLKITYYSFLENSTGEISKGSKAAPRHRSKRLKFNCSQQH